MADMGFLPAVRRILDATAAKRQTVLFSATLDGDVAVLTRAYQRDPVRREVDHAEHDASRAEHRFETVKPHVRLERVAEVIDSEGPTIVFCRTRRGADKVAKKLGHVGVRAAAIHGGRSQNQRDRALAQFAAGSVGALIATDVAARGIDVVDLDLVINYELHAQPEVYIHRIGRTGRAGKQGLAISFASLRERAKIEAIEKLMERRLEPLARDRSVNTTLELLSNSPESDARMETIQISGGRRDKIRPGDILGALTGEAGGLKAADIGMIEIHDRLSYVAVSKSVSREAVESLNQGRIKGQRFRASII